MNIDFTDFISFYLDELGHNYSIREGQYGEYFLTTNPIIEETRASCMIFIDGIVSSLNGDINGKQRITLKEVCKLTGFLNEYIQFVLEKSNIPTYQLNKYRELLISKNLGDRYNKGEFHKFKKVFGSNLFLSESDILQTNEIKPMVTTKFHKTTKKAKKKNNIVEIQQTQEEYRQCLEYTNSRCIEFDEDRIEPVTLKVGEWKVLGIALRHSNNHTKYRLLNDKLRYLSVGTFQTPFVTKNNNHTQCLFVEGQIEAESIRNLDGWDIYALANTNTIGNIEFLQEYEKCVVLIDNDTFQKVEVGIRKKISEKYPNLDLTILPKYDTMDKSKDFNKHLCEEGEEDLLNYLENRLDNI